MITREEVFDRVRRRGWHQYRVLGGPLPSWSYSIGCWESYGSAELVLAGGSSFTAAQTSSLLVELVAGARTAAAPRAGDRWPSAAVGPVRFAPVHSSWAQELLLGAEDFYADRGYQRLQVVPDAAAPTIDVPDLARPFDTAREPAWRWLREPWPYRLGPRTFVVTDLQALRGSPVLSVRRHHDEAAGSPWDLFAMAEDVIPNELARAAPLGLLVALDPTLDVVEQLAPGQSATRRDGGAPWRVSGAV